MITYIIYDSSITIVRDPHLLTVLRPRPCSIHNTTCVGKPPMFHGAIDSNIFRFHLLSWKKNLPYNIRRQMRHREIKKGFRCFRGRPFFDRPIQAHLAMLSQVMGSKQLVIDFYWRCNSWILHLYVLMKIEPDLRYDFA